MKRIAFTTYAKIIAWILGILGFASSCEIPGLVEYGAPSADYVVKGKVTDKATQQPLKNMAVIHKSYTSPYGNDTVRTNAEGSYELNFTSFPYRSEDLTVYASDLDGATNGLYKSDTLRIKASELKQTAKKRGRWNFGTFEKTGADFTLNKSSEKE